MQVCRLAVLAVGEALRGFRRSASGRRSQRFAAELELIGVTMRRRSATPADARRAGEDQMSTARTEGFPISSSIVTTIP